MSLPQPRHSPHGFGVLSHEDVPFLLTTLEKVMAEFGMIHMLELGVANGGTTAGIYNYCQAMNWPFWWTGLDMECGRPYFDLSNWGEFICGDFHSEVIHKEVEGNYILLFIDGCHCYECVKLDFQIYAPKIEPRGFILFHDTNSHPDWQNHHVQCKPDRMIETRRALADLKLFPLARPDYSLVGEQNDGTTQGMMLFQRISV